ncbi:MAG TPA: thioredoxin domain-containing protein, partial [Polyangia bacterium]|nr:thioredoxin domain-containing protein [Polyangia bacterium]
MKVAPMWALAACALALAGCKQGTEPAPARSLEGDPALPGVARRSPELEAKLRAALAAKGAAYRPRTHHLNPDGSPKYTNRLILEASPYLLQHAHNPVNWYPWGDEAFARAKREGKPIFLSVGYSTCHWCHVMEAESFEDEEIARYLNENYVAIKVDREERPDIDAVYVSAVQSLTGSGGWPMSVWLTPERTPFFGGTYFPPRDGARGARQGFLSLLTELATTYHADPNRIVTEAGKLAAAVRQDLGGPLSSPAASAGPTGTPEAAVISALVEYLKRAFDNSNGGMRGAPKFPSSLPVRLLLRYHRRTGDAEALRMATLTLEKMAAGGINDQIGGGFHRYSTDERWLVPHFEKMLYDNALLAVAYLEAHQATGRADFARIARETVDYVLAEMTAPSGAFYSATDADSDGAEGKFFIWSEPEIRAALGPGPVADRFVRYYGVTPAGNFEGRNILFVPKPDEQERAALVAARAKLYAIRARRIPPARDDKILAAWNGLMISALAQAGRILGEPRYTAAAARAAEFLLSTVRPGGALARSFEGGRLGPPGFLEDYAFLAACLFDLFEASFDPRWLREALALCADTERLFGDPAFGGWFTTSVKHETLLAREKPSYDGAIPSGTSVAILNALRAAAFTGDDHWRAGADPAV